MSPPRVQAWPVPAVPGQLQLRSLVMGAGTSYGIEQIEGLDLPPIVAAESERAGTDGTVGGIDTVAKRSLILHMVLHPDQVGGGAAKALLARDLKGAFAKSQAPIALALNHADLGQLVLLGRPRRCAYIEDRSALWHNQEGVLAQFDALDPLLYSGTLQDVVIAYGTAGTNAGLPFNANVPGLGMSFQPRRIVQNGGFESAAVTDGGWLTTGALDFNVGATLTRDTITKHAGAASGKVVTSGATTSQGARQLTLTNLLPNTSYTFTVWVNLTTAGGLLRLIVRDITNGIVVGSANMTTVGVWTQITQAITTGPTGPVQVQFGVRDDGTAVTRTYYVDDMRGDLTSAVQAYTDAAAVQGATFGAIGGGAGAAGFLVCVNSGNQASDPVTVISAAGGPVTGPLHVERVESGEVITLNYSLAAGDTLELDHDLHTVVLNGNANRADVVDASTAWWAMQPGNNTIHYRTDGPGAGSFAEIKWRDARL